MSDLRKHLRASGTAVPPRPVLFAAFRQPVRAPDKITGNVEKRVDRNEPGAFLRRENVFADNTSRCRADPFPVPIGP